MTTARGRGTLFAVLATGAVLFGLVIAVRAGASTSSATPRITSRASVRSASPRTPTLHGAGNITSRSRATAPGGPPPPDNALRPVRQPGDHLLELAELRGFEQLVRRRARRRLRHSGRHRLEHPDRRRLRRVLQRTGAGEQREREVLFERRQQPTGDAARGASRTRHSRTARTSRFRWRPGWRSARAPTGSRCRRTRTSSRRGSGAGGTAPSSRTWTPPGRTRATASAPDARRGGHGRPASEESRTRRIRSIG